MKNDEIFHLYFFFTHYRISTGRFAVIVFKNPAVIDGGQYPPPLNTYDHCY
jgi:hypothetical protein